MTNLRKPRMKNIETAIQWEKFHKELKLFMGLNNFKQDEIYMVMHLLNSFYMMGYELREDNDE